MMVPKRGAARPPYIPECRVEDSTHLEEIDPKVLTIAQKEIPK
jgi:hypothetical protein